MAQPTKQFFSLQEYLDFEEKSQVKNEYYNGKTYMWAGASPYHNTITLNIGIELGTAFRGRACRAYIYDMRIVIK